MKLKWKILVYRKTEKKSTGSFPSIYSFYTSSYFINMLFVSLINTFFVRYIIAHSSNEFITKMTKGIKILRTMWEFFKHPCKLQYYRVHQHYQHKLITFLMLIWCFPIIAAYGDKTELSNFHEEQKASSPLMNLLAADIVEILDIRANLYYLLIEDTLYI